MSDNLHTDWPVWANETVEIKPADPQWPEKGAAEAARLKALLAPYGASEVEHIGSTSVPGLPSKPILDLMAKVPSYDELEALSICLKREDWHYVPPELDGVAWRRFFVKVKDDKRVCHLHLIREDEERWNRQLRFRDILRGDPVLTEQYAELKRELAVRHKDDREAYTHAKSDFVERVLGSKRSEMG